MEVTSESERQAFERLEQQFAAMQTYLDALQKRGDVGLTAVRVELNRLTVAALAADSHGSYVVANDSVAQLTGFKVRDLEAMSVWDLTAAPEIRNSERLWAAFLETRQQRGTYELRGRHGPVHVAYYAGGRILPDLHISLLCECRKAGV